MLESHAVTTSNLIQILTLVVAILAVFIGPMVTLYIGKKQNEVANKTVELSRRIASKQIMAPMRQAWINDLRDKISELSSSGLHYWTAGYEDRSEAEYQRVGLLESEVYFRINPQEKDHQELMSAIRGMVQALQTGHDDADRFIVSYNQLNAIAQKIFKTEWNRVKNDIDKP